MTRESSRAVLERYETALVGVFGSPQLVVDRAEGAYVIDADGRRYLDLLGGIAVNSLGHNHPALVGAITQQASSALHVSNFFTTGAQVSLAERLLKISAAPAGSRVFLCNSGAEANETAIKIARRTGRPRIIAAENGFHGRTTGALALTAKAAYREPFEPLLPGVTHVPYDDIGALESAVGDDVAAIVLEPVQGEAGVVVPDAGYLAAARDIATRAGALLVVDEVQTGIGRTGLWFEFQRSGIVPDVVTSAKGLGGGVPIGAVITVGERVSSLLGAGQHGTTFGGNPLACAAANAVLETIEADGLLAHVESVGAYVAERIAGLGDPRVTGQSGAGLLRAIHLRDQVAPAFARAAREAGFIVNPVTPDRIRLAPPLVITREEIATFLDVLPTLLGTIGAHP